MSIAHIPPPLEQEKPSSTTAAKNQRHHPWTQAAANLATNPISLAAFDAIGLAMPYELASKHKIAQQTFPHVPKGNQEPYLQRVGIAGAIRASQNSHSFWAYPLAEQVLGKNTLGSVASALAHSSAAAVSSQPFVQLRNLGTKGFAGLSPQKKLKTAYRGLSNGFGKLLAYRAVSATVRTQVEKQIEQHASNVPPYPKVMMASAIGCIVGGVFSHPFDTRATRKGLKLSPPTNLIEHFKGVLPRLAFIAAAGIVNGGLIQAGREKLAR